MVTTMSRNLKLNLSLTSSKVMAESGVPGKPPPMSNKLNLNPN
jgi:hypothetical protein